MVKRRNAASAEHAEGSVTLTTEEICRTHIEAAIFEYAHRQTIAPCHLLASAAHDLMRGYAKRHKLKLRADLHSTVRDLLGDKAKDVIDQLKLPYNSVKHFINDSDAAVTMHPSFVELTLLQALLEFGSLFGALTPNMVVFATWVHLVHPRIQTKYGVAAGSLLPSALTGTTRHDQLTDVRRMIDEHDDGIDWKAALSTKGLWKDDPA